MASLRVDFQEGFEGDDVVVRVGDRSEVRREHVTTSDVVGYAGSVELEVDEGTLDLTVDVPSRGLRASTSVGVQGDVYVGASISDGELALLVSAEPMGYL